MPHLLRRLDLELAAWVAGLALLACTDPDAGGHFSLCAFRWLGVPFCPGCGLGHAVAYLFRGDLAASLRAHPLGLFAVAVLAGRIVTLARRAWGGDDPAPGRTFFAKLPSGRRNRTN